MNTPICDFARGYAAAELTRFHMPGHKGKSAGAGSPGMEGPEDSRSRIQALDITEIEGADVLYDSHDMIRESEENAAKLFGSARTVYSTEGSSLGIRAMLFLARMYAEMRGRRASVAAGRNAHRVFLEAAALLDIDVQWMGTGENLLRCHVTAENLEQMFRDPETAPTAVYITSPDYLGNETDIRPLSEICRKNGAILLVDNAHGAYLKYLEKSRHPMDCGADLCCDSAHKTLPVLTGGAYLHASKDCPESLIPLMERAMALFASTSPSWLILQSLDAMNAMLADDYPDRIRKMAKLLRKMKQKLAENGWNQAGDEELKLTICPKGKGFTGTELGNRLREKGVVCEFADPDYLVMMVTPENEATELERLGNVLLRMPARLPICSAPPAPGIARPVFSPREVLFRPFERVPVESSLGRILASPSVSCPPAVPIVICGERIDENALNLFRYYGIKYCDVIKTA